MTYRVFSGRKGGLTKYYMEKKDYIELKKDLIIPKDKVDELVEKLEVLEILEKREITDLPKFISFIKYFCLTYAIYEKEWYKYSFKKLTRQEIKVVKSYFERKK